MTITDMLSLVVHVRRGGVSTCAMKAAGSANEAKSVAWREGACSTLAEQHRWARSQVRAVGLVYQGQPRQEPLPATRHPRGRSRRAGTRPPGRLVVGGRTAVRREDDGRGT